MALTHAGKVSAASGNRGVTARVRAWLRAAGGLVARWNQTSAAKAAGAPIGPAERVLATDHDLNGSLVAVTRAALYYQDRGAPGRAWSRLGWEDIDAVGWDDRHHVLALTGVRPGGMWRKELVLAPGTPLVELARERLTSTQLASTAVRLGDQVCARVTARRQPGSGKVIWTVVVNGAASISDPAIRARVKAAIADLQGQAGIPAPETADPAWLSLTGALPLAMPGGRAEDATLAEELGRRRTTPGSGPL
jgi:hypothetical protein